MECFVVGILSFHHIQAVSLVFLLVIEHVFAYYGQRYIQNPFQHPSIMELFEKIVYSFQSLFILVKGSILDVWYGSEYAYDCYGPYF